MFTLIASGMTDNRKTLRIIMITEVFVSLMIGFVALISIII